MCRTIWDVALGVILKKGMHWIICFRCFWSNEHQHNNCDDSMSRGVGVVLFFVYSCPGNSIPAFPIRNSNLEWWWTTRFVYSCHGNSIPAFLIRNSNFLEWWWHLCYFWDFRPLWHLQDNIMITWSISIREGVKKSGKKAVRLTAWGGEGSPPSSLTTSILWKILTHFILYKMAK